ncbi:MAG: type VI secretion system membrane subunit TssM, partial [Aeromonadaceae bacterium]
TCWVGERAIMLAPRGELLAHPESPSLAPEEERDVLWHHLLGWIAGQRRQQPLSGLVVTIDLAWLSHASAMERKSHAALMRARLQEVTDALHSQLPLYVVFTKLDLLSGFEWVYGQLDEAEREALLGVTFTPRSGQGKQWLPDLIQFWEQWLARLNSLLPDLLLRQNDVVRRDEIFAFVRQLVGLQEYVVTQLEEMLVTAPVDALLVRGIYLGSLYQHGVSCDAFSLEATRRYGLPEPVYSSRKGTSTLYFLRHLFSAIIFPEAHLAGESRQHRERYRRRLAMGGAALCLLSLPLLYGWHYYYHLNATASQQVLAKAQAFTTTKEASEHQALGLSLLPRLNLIREATLAFGDYRQRTPMLADLGLYQGGKIGPVVEGSYLQLLRLRFLPALMQGLQHDLQLAPAGSEQKLEILRIMRMLDDASGRNSAQVMRYMAERWQRALPGQGYEQEQLLAHLTFALAHTDWFGARQQHDGAAITAFAPFASTIAEAQRELGGIPIQQRLYQSLQTQSAASLPPELNVKQEVGASFDAVFVLSDEQAGRIPRFYTQAGAAALFAAPHGDWSELSALDSWVLGQSRHLSGADRQALELQIHERYVMDYVNYWQSLLMSLDVQPMQGTEQALEMLSTITGDEQPFLRVLATLGTNTQLPFPADVGVDNGGAGGPSQLLSKGISQPFSATNGLLTERGTQGSQIQEINQKLLGLRNYLEAIVHAPEPGAAALRAVQLRVANRYADPLFSLQQYARNLPEPLDRWVGQLAEQTAALLVEQALSSLALEWQKQVLEPFNENLANRYPFEPDAEKDVPLSEMERFFAPGGTLDNFYQVKLKPMVDSGLLDGDYRSPVQAELVKQMARAQKIRQIFFTTQGTLEVQFALEPMELTANKRRSVLNLDGQLLEYAHGRRTKVPLVWPNTMREGSESKLTLVPAVANRSPRSEGFVGPWALFRLMGKGELTPVNESSFDVRFPVDEGAMSYRVYTDGAENPFSGSLFSQFRLPELIL